MAGGKAGKDSGKTKQKAVSRSARAGLQFPVGRSVALIYQFPFVGLECFFFYKENFVQDPSPP